MPDELRRRMDNMLSIRRAIASDPLFEKELALDERLDARIDRLFKRLIQIKSMKQILRQTSRQSATKIGREENYEVNAKLSASSAIKRLGTFVSKDRRRRNRASGLRGRRLPKTHL